MDALPIDEPRGLPYASAIPGRMHACGHDSHMAIALGVAAVLSEMRGDLSGRAMFIFQPGEETLSGAQAMLADGALEQGTPAWGVRFREDLAPALLTGVAAHTILAQPSIAGAGAGLALTAFAHARGWPIPIGGSQAISDAMVDDLRAHGGELVLEHEVASLAELPPSTVTLLDVTPKALIRLAGDAMPGRYRRALEAFRYGDGVAKVDFALNAPVPWTNPDLHLAGTVHVGGTRAEMADAENQVQQGLHPEHPYVLVSQP